MAVDLGNQSCTINDISEECLLIIIKNVLFSDPYIELESLLYINKIFLKLIKENIYIISPKLKEKEKIIIPKPYLYISNSFMNNQFLKSVVIQDSITYIHPGAFRNCKALVYVVISLSVTYIGHSAFHGCKALVKIVIPVSVTYIDYFTFAYCTALITIVIPDSVTYIGVGAFRNCYELVKIVIPNSVTYIGNGAFSGCYKLTTVTMPKLFEPRFRRSLIFGSDSRVDNIKFTFT